MSLLTRRVEVLFKEESTYGTDPSPSNSADAVVVENPRISFPTEVIDPEPVRASLSRVPPIHGRKYGQFTCSVPIKGSGAAGTAPEFGPMLKACAMSETIVASTSVTYKPASAAADRVSGTLYMYQDGKLFEINGMRGSVVARFPAGQRAMLDFTFQGLVQDDVDAALPSISGIDATVPPVVKGSSFAIGGYAAVIANLEADLGNVLAMTDSVNAAEGYGAAEITGRQPQGSFDPEMTLVATHDYWSDWEDGTSQALTIAIGGTAGNILTFTAPAVHNRELQPEDRSGIATYRVPVSFAESSGDDEISFAFT